MVITFEKHKNFDRFCCVCYRASNAVPDKDPDKKMVDFMLHNFKSRGKSG